MVFKSTLIEAAVNVAGRVHRGFRPSRHFRGAFSNYDEAMAAVRLGSLKGYNHEALTDISRDEMNKVAIQDYPVIMWLKEILAAGGRVLDAGGHVGTKYRAFQKYLPMAKLEWWVYDLPAFVRVGRMLAEKDRLVSLKFVDHIELVPPSDVFLGSGLLQYLDISLETLMSRLKAKPPHILLNKVATREGHAVVTLENFGIAEVPYQIRNRVEFEKSLKMLGYEIVDKWMTPHLSHTISGHTKLGASTSRGYYAVLKIEAGRPARVRTSAPP